MKKVFVLAVLTATMLIANGCSGEGGVNTSDLSENLKAEYEFYEDSIDNIKNAMGLSQEKADSVFTVLVTECSIDEKIQSVNKHGLNNEGVFDVWAGWRHLIVTIKDNSVEKVMQGTEHLYPTAEKSETEEVGPKTDETTHMTAYQLVSMEGHPVLYDYLSTAHDFWDNYAEGRIDFADKHINYESGKTALMIDAYLSLERNLKEHMIRSFEIYPKDKLSLDEGLDLAKSYVPMDILKKYYALEWSRCYCKDEYSMYVILYKPTEDGKKTIETQNLDYNYVMVIIDTKDNCVTGIKIDSVYSLSRHINEYKETDWEYDFLD